MAGRRRQKIIGLGALGRRALRGINVRQLRSLLPPITLKLIFRALLGVLLFFCGIVLGAWLIFRYRRHDPA